MRHLALALAATMALLFLPTSAEAYKFGKTETIHHIQDVKITGQNNEELYLGHMTRVQNFLLGMYIEDAGYVLGVKGDSKRYYQMPEGEQLARLQRNGSLPDPLPTYEIATLDYVFGYSLWWTLVLTALFYGVRAIRKRNAPEPAASATAQPSGTTASPPPRPPGTAA